MPNMQISRNGMRPSPGFLDSIRDEAADWALMVKTRFDEISLELKQLSLVTGSTSAGSANVMSTH